MTTSIFVLLAGVSVSVTAWAQNPFGPPISCRVDSARGVCVYPDGTTRPLSGGGAPYVPSSSPAPLTETTASPAVVAPPAAGQPLPPPPEGSTDLSAFHVPEMQRTDPATGQTTSASMSGPDCPETNMYFDDTGRAAEGIGEPPGSHVHITRQWFANSSRCVIQVIVRDPNSPQRERHYQFDSDGGLFVTDRSPTARDVNQRYHLFPRRQQPQIVYDRGSGARSFRIRDASGHEFQFDSRYGVLNAIVSSAGNILPDHVSVPAGSPSQSVTYQSPFSLTRIDGLLLNGQASPPYFTDRVGHVCRVTQAQIYSRRGSNPQLRFARDNNEQALCTMIGRVRRGDACSPEFDAAVSIGRTAGECLQATRPAASATRAGRARSGAAATTSGAESGSSGGSSGGSSSARP